MKKFYLFVVYIFIMGQVSFANVASWYGAKFENKLTASGYLYNSKQFTCAENTYPFGTVLKVTNKKNNKSVIVVVTDRGAFSEKYGRHIDLSKSAFDEIAIVGEGLIKVKIEVVNKKHTFKYKHGSPEFTKEEYEKYLK